MKRALMRAAIAALALGSAYAHADAIYTYTSQELNALPGPEAPLTMAFDFSDDGKTLLSWSAYQENVGTLSSTDSSPDLQAFLLTDAQGDVTDWYIAINSSAYVGYAGVAFDSWSNLNGGLPYPFVPLPDGVVAADLARNGNYTGSIENDPGVWKHVGSIASAQLVADVPEPSSAALLLAGLALLGATLRRPLDRRQPDLQDPGIA